MIQGPSFLYFLHFNDKFYYVDSYGNVLTIADPKALEYSPDGWQEISILTELNQKYFGFERSFTIPLHFVEDGAAILKKIYYSQGFEGKLNMTIAEQRLYLQSPDYYFFYDRLYSGEVDFSTYAHEGALVTANIIEGGLAKLIKANENTTYEIDVPTDLFIKMDGITLAQTGNLQILPAFPMRKSETSTNFLMQVVYVNSEGQSTGLAFSSSRQEPVEGLTFADKIAKDNWIAYNTDSQPITIHVKGQLVIRCTRNDPFLGFRMRFLRSGMVLTEQDTLKLHPNTIALAVGQTYTVDVDMSVTLQAGEKLLLEGIFVGGSTGAIDTVIEFRESGFLAFGFNNRYKTTNINAVTPLYLFQKLIDKISDGKATAQSQLLTDHAALMITSGDAIRGLAGAKIKTSLTQFFNSMNCLFNIAMSIKGDTAIIEAKGPQFEGAVIELGEVKDLKVSVATEFIYNTIKVGYPNQDYDNVNGRDEFNNALQSTTDIKRIVKEFTLMSDYRGDSYGIEFTRINLEGKTTTDSGADNDVFLIMTDGAGNLDRSLNATATGLVSPETVFNIAISPKRMLLAHGWFIRSFMHRLDGTLIKFQTTEKNSKLVAGGIAETADVLVGDLAPRKFLPTLFEFETQVPEDYQTLLDDNPVRRYRFTYNGISMQGIALKSGFEPSTNKSQIFTLLADATCDLTLLNALYE